MFKPSEHTKNIVFSHLNYQTIEHSLKDQENTFLEILMTTNQINFEKVIVVGTRPSYIGRKNLKNPLTGFFNPKGLGGEVGTVIKNKEKCKINSFGFYVQKNTFKRLKFRLNIYSTKRNKPKKLLKSNVYFDVGKDQIGEYLVDIEDFNIQSDIFVSIELLEVNKDEDLKPLFHYSAFQNIISTSSYRAISMDR